MEIYHKAELISGSALCVGWLYPFAYLSTISRRVTIKVPAFNR